MYYNEKLINGIWYYKTSPRMEWKPMSVVQLTNKIAAQERELNKLRLSGVVRQSEQLCDCVMPDPINPWDNVDKDTCRKCNSLIA